MAMARGGRGGPGGDLRRLRADGFLHGLELVIERGQAAGELLDVLGHRAHLHGGAKVFSTTLHPSDGNGSKAAV